MHVQCKSSNAHELVSVHMHVMELFTFAEYDYSDFYAHIYYNEIFMKREATMYIPWY